MGRIPRETIDAVRDRTDIVAVISRHVTLVKRGNSFVGLCPFHQEKSPSFNVVPAKAMYHCFGCQAGGDVFRFLMDLEGLSFIEAVKELAGPAGITIEERELSPDERRALKSRGTLFDVLEETAQFFESTLWTHADGQIGRDYLEERAIDEGIARRARIGYAADGWTRLLDHLHRKGFEARLALEAGLAKERKSGDGHYDFFRNRLMFPIRDERSRVIGFGGRKMDDEDFGGKYMNTPETRLYDKKRVLYGIETARSAIQRADQVVIVEGYFDVLAMQAAGHDEAVASCGTALTAEHLEVLGRLTKNIVLLTDADRAGQEAAERALPAIVGAGLHGYRVSLPGAKDPDELVKEQGIDALNALLEHRQSLIEWVISQKVMSYADKTSMGAMSTSMARERILKELLPMLGQLPRRQLPRIAGLLRVPEIEILRAIGGGDQAPPPSRGGHVGWKPSREMVHVLWLLVHRYEQVADLLQRVPPAVFADHAPVHPALARLLTGEHPANVVEDEADEGVRRTLVAVVARDRLYGKKVAARGLCEILDNLARPRLMARKTWLQHRLTEIQRSGAVGELRQVLVDNQVISKALSELQAAREGEDYGGFVQALATTFDDLGTAVPEPEPQPVAVPTNPAGNSDTPPPADDETPLENLDPDGLDEPPPPTPDLAPLPDPPDLPPAPDYDGWIPPDDDEPPPFP